MKIIKLFLIIIMILISYIFISCIITSEGKIYSPFIIIQPNSYDWVSAEGLWITIKGPVEENIYVGTRVDVFGKYKLYKSYIWTFSYRNNGYAWVQTHNRNWNWKYVEYYSKEPMWKYKIEYRKEYLTGILKYKKFTN